ncbi:MAG TPA: DUF4350 domain-containing protein [Intrasporangium sp.]|nr:DUF4350 domain-containing protein [Intrasporangium sp.]
MTTTHLPAAPAPVTRTRRRRLRMTAVLVIAAVVALTLLAFLSGGADGAGKVADPDSSRRSGSRALAQVLRQQGVDVQVVRSITALETARMDASTSVVVGSFDYLGEAAAQRTAQHASRAGRFVLLEPSDLALEDLGIPLASTARASVQMSAQCTSEVAEPDDRIDAAATFYRSTSSIDGDGPAMPEGATGCFAEEDASSAVVVLPAASSRPETVVLGSIESVTNAKVSEASHAAMGLRAFGATSRLVWYLPDVMDLAVPDAGGQYVPTDRAVPEWFTPGVVLLALAFVVLAVARGRRLGRIVAEPLPVVVRAVETTEARGRLYRRASDRGRAAGTLRGGTRSRLAARLGLPHHAGADAVVGAVARATDREATAVRALLYGADPVNDSDLVLLAEQLAQLEENVRGE